MAIPVDSEGQRDAQAQQDASALPGEPRAAVTPEGPGEPPAATTPEGSGNPGRPQGPGRPPPGTARRIVREIGLTLITAGVVLLLFVAYQLWGTSIAEEHSQQTLAGQFKAAVVANQAGRPGEPSPATGTTGTPASPTNPPVNPTSPSNPASPTGSGSPTGSATAPVILPGGAVDHLRIPAIGVDKYVVEGTGESDLRRGPGHYTGTPYPGQAGNVAIAGHRTTYGAPFFDLNKMKVGDPIYLTDLTGKTWGYVVSRAPEVVAPDDVSVIAPTTYAQLTLTTCNPRFSATSRLVVSARLTGQAQPPDASHVPGSAARTVPPAQDNTLAGADNLGSGDSGAWLPVGLYGAALVAAWVSTRILVRRIRRWRKVGALAGGIAVCLVPMWFLFENVVRLLPQSI